MIIDRRSGAEARCRESHENGKVCVKELWACKFARQVSVESASRRCV
jgi:hypothetical protein